jgi:polysaccharide biosynthesis transport protein
MTPWVVWAFLRRWLWFLLLGVLLSAGASYLVSSRLPKVYEASAKLLVMPGLGTSSAADSNAVLAAQNLTRTYAELAKTRPVIEAAINAGNLSLNYDQAIKLLDSTPVRDTQLIEITARGADPAQMVSLANQVAATLVQQTQAAQSSRFAASEDSLSKQLDQLTADIASDNDKIANLKSQLSSAQNDGQLTQLEFDLSQRQQAYAAAARSYQDQRIAEAQSSDTLSVAEPATLPSTPVQPRVLIIVLIASIAGLALAGSAALLVETLDDRISSPRRVVRYTGLSVLGVLSARSAGRSSSLGRYLSLPGESERADVSQAVEPFRILGANLEAAATERSLRSLLITSCHRGEGKTSVAVNLAIILAQAGKHVILVDADLRAPTLHELFGVANATGLSSVLSSDEQQDPWNYPVQTRVPRLRLVTSGAAPPDPSQVVGTQRVQQYLGALAREADLVIIDSSPVLGVSDSIVLARHVDAVLLVANARRTRGDEAAEAVAALRNAGGWVAGVVLNHIPRRRLRIERARPPLALGTRLGRRLAAGKLAVRNGLAFRLARTEGYWLIKARAARTWISTTSSKPRSAPKSVSTKWVSAKSAPNWVAAKCASAQSSCRQAAATGLHVARSGWSVVSRNAWQGVRIRPWAAVKRMAKRWPKGASS